MKEEKEREGEGEHCNEMRGNQIKGGGGQQPWRQERGSLRLDIIRVVSMPVSFR